ncbi:single-stranded DNA-binding protein [Xanthomonas arboricola]|uniref:Single-stranded DNA-binding protein n=1 Tax=Xanthomonas arboricola TaxID=56448 RepID=A0AB73H259_9XANT|nr:single-stranded DNA-binding protein [Xanthomonas arboricola]MBB5672484.1 single stranded DNA-binding protein [Xanthomonas arboricola]
MARRTKNKVVLIGFLGREAELRERGDRKFIVFDIGTTESWGPKEDRKEKTTWTRCIAGQQTAVNLAKFTTQKGAYLHIEGSLQNRKVEKGGVTTYYTDVRVDEFIALDKLERNDSGNTPQPAPMEDFADDDIPF